MTADQEVRDLDDHSRAILALYGIQTSPRVTEFKGPLIVPLPDELENLARDYLLPEYTEDFMGRKAALHAICKHYGVRWFRDVTGPAREEIWSLLEAAGMMNMVIDFADIPGELVRAQKLLERRDKGEIQFDPDALWSNA